MKALLKFLSQFYPFNSFEDTNKGTELMRAAAARSNYKRLHEVSNATGLWAATSGFLAICLKLIPIKVVLVVFGIMFSMSFALLVLTYTIYLLMIRYNR